MSFLSNSSLFLVLFIVVSLCSASVRSETNPSAIRLSSNAGADGLCARSAPASCPVSCFRPHPVCGVDGVTYWCKCADAICSGSCVTKLGFCEVSNGGNELVSGQALLLVHIVWLIVLEFFVLFGLF